MTDPHNEDLLLVTSKILGSGHYNAAKNLLAGLERRKFKIDFYDWDFFGGKAYEFMINNVPKVWQLLNEAYQNELILSFNKFHDNWNTFTDKTRDILHKKEFWWQIRYTLFDLESFIKLNAFLGEEDVFKDKKPDWNRYSKIVLTMPGTQSLGYSNYYADKSYVLVTDYGQVDKSWTVYSPNTFFVANQEAQDYLRSFKELDDSKIVQTGIPVSLQTKKLSQLDKHDLRTSLGIKSKRFFVLAGGGSGGRKIAGMVNKLIKNPLPQAQVLVICGRNEELLNSLRAKLENYPQANIQLAGYLDNEELLKYYRAADMVLTKPGGITLTELINLQTPIGVYYSHPQESGNLRRIQQHRLGIWNFQRMDFLRELNDLDEDDFDYFSKKMKKVARYDSVEQIAAELDKTSFTSH